MAVQRQKGDLRKTSGIRRPGERKNAQNQFRQSSRSADERGLSETMEKRTKKSGDMAVVSSTSTKRNTASQKNRSASRQSGKKITKKNSTPFVILLVLFWVAVVFFSAFLSYTYLVDKYENPINEENIYIDPSTQVEFVIEKGSTTRQIADKLYDMGLIGNRHIYRFLSKFNGYDGQYSAGTHILCSDMTYEEIMVILTGKPEVVTVLFPEGFTTHQIAARLEANNICKSSDFYNAIETIDVSSYPFIQDDTFDEHRDNRLDGYLFPDTYEFEANSNPEDVIYKMLNRFMEVFKPDYYTRAEELGMSVDDIVILASIIEREAKLSDEKSKIAGVYYNRMRSKDQEMQYLQSDATIQYIYVKLYNRSLSKVTDEAKQVNDQYNTYLKQGLPPGPICSPGLDSIIAALSPEEHDYYYFALIEGTLGQYYYSKTLEEHKAHGG